MRKSLFVLGLLLSALAASQASGVSVTLKPYSGAGYTTATVYDTELSNYGGENQYNYGGKTSYTDLFQGARVYLVKFDLSAIPNLSQVTAVNSATLRVYRTAYSFSNSNLQVAQLAQDWLQGTGNGGWDGACDGAQWFARNAGTTVPKGSLVSDGGGIYHLNGVSSLANDPVNAGGYFVRMAGSPGNYNNAGSAGLYAVCGSLAALQAAGGTRSCFWDSANSRLYVNKNDADVRWYATSDLWTTAGATITGSYINDNAYPTAPAVPGWVAFNVTGITRNWIISGQSNYGVRVMQPANCQNTIVSSRYTTDPTQRPELVLDLQYGPPPTQPAIKLVPATLSFSGHAADPLPSAQSVTVQNTGVGTLNWTAAVRAPAPAWISVTNSSGTDNGSFNVSVNWQGMATGTYTAYVDVTDSNASNSPQTVTVTMQVLAPPQPAIALAPTSLAFTGHAADPLPAAQNVTVQNSGAGTLNWTATVRSPAPAWVSLTNPTGTGNGSFSVAVNWQGMAAGTYTAYVDVVDPNASNTPQTVTVIMQVQPPPQPTIQLVPASLTFAAKATDPIPATQSVTVKNTGTAPLNWTAALRTPVPAWITLTNPSGTDNGSFTVGVNQQGMTPGTYTAYVDVADPNATNSPQTATITLQVRSNAPAAAHSFTNTARGTHPHALTLGSSTITVDLSSLPNGTSVYRAILVPHLGGNNGGYPGADRSASPMQIASADAPGVWLAAAGPRYLTLDCTAAVQRAVQASPKTLHLNVQSWPSWNTGQEFRLDVWCNVDAVNPIQQVTGTQAVHRSGDTMITFAEVNPPVTNPTPLGSDLNTAQANMDSPNEVRYRIYRSSSPIDAATILAAELVDEIAPMSGWNWTFTPSDWNSATIPTLPVADLTPSVPGTGIYVRRAQATQSVYYAVSRCVNGEEDLGGWTSGQNCTSTAVSESAGTGMVLEWKTTTPSSFDFVNNPTMHYYAKWECPPNYNVPSYAHNYLVAVPPNLANPCPVDVAVHCWGGSYEGGYAWWYEAESGGLLVATNEIPYDWWVGFHENAGTLRPWTNVDGNGGGVCRNFSQNRIWSFYHDFVATKWNVDPNHIIISGVSMGGSGSCQWGIRAGDKFCYIDSWVGVHIPRLTPTFLGSYQQVWGPDTWNCLFENTGLNVWDYWDDNQWLRSHVSTDTPFVCFSNGKNDGAIGWPQAQMFAKALQETRRPHLFTWGQDGHGQRATLPGTLSDRYIGVTINLNKTLPAFTYCSLDSNMGSGDPADGDPTGTLNAYLLWQPQDSTDTSSTWEMTCNLTSAAPQGTCTVDVTPRRCQAFKPAAGKVCSWTNTDIASGTVIASGTAAVDANGLITIPQTTVSKTKNRIKITAPGLIGDMNGDGYVNVSDLQLLVAAWASQKTPPSSNWNAAADLNGDGFVNVGDLQLLVTHWGEHL